MAQPDASGTPSYGRAQRGGVAWMRGFTFPRLLGMVVVLVVGAVGLVGVSTQPATAQIADLDPDLCATTYKPSADAGSRTEADCRTLIAWRNTVVNHPNSVIGATHPMRLWGTGSQTTFDTWKDASGEPMVSDVNGTPVITEIDLRNSGLAGSLPGELPDLKVLRLRSNFLTGELPAWVYTSTSLEILELAYNRFSGAIAGERFNAPELAHLILESNRFSGTLPNFNLTRLPKLRNLILSRNLLSGPIPAGWSGFADGRGMQRLDIAYNNISGNLPAWISNLKFANFPAPSWTAFRPAYWHYTVNWQNNRICVPASLVIPEYRKLNGTVGQVMMYLEPQRCPDSRAGIIKPVENLQTEVVDVQVDANGRPATDQYAGEMVATVKGLRVTWDRPADFLLEQSSNVKWLYSVWSYLSVPTSDNEVPQQDGTTSYRYCPQDRLRAGTPFLTTETTFEVIITRNNCNITDPNTLYDPTKYTVDIATTFALRVPWSPSLPTFIYNAVVYTGAVGVQGPWGIYMADDDQKTYRDVANVARLANNLNIWVWDAANQIWIERDLQDQDFSSLNLDPGTALAFQRRVPLSWLAEAGLSTADEDTPVRLENGWNVISAGGDVTRPSGNTGAFFLDDSLRDCDSLQGAIVIMRYSASSESFDAELPCHPSVEADMARDTGIGTISEIEEADTLFIYFRSVLPVTIQWDATNNKYIPTTS